MAHYAFRCKGDPTPMNSKLLNAWGSVVLLMLTCSAFSGCTPSLHDVIGLGDMAQVDAMLAAHPELTASENELGKQPLHYAIYYRQPEALDLLLKAGADINAADNTGMTALHVAAITGWREGTLWLLDNGADWAQEDVFGDRPSHTAAIYNQRGVLSALFKRGDSLTEPNKAGMTPMDLARKHRNDQSVERIESLIGGG